VGVGTVAYKIFQGSDEQTGRKPDRSVALRRGKEKRRTNAADGKVPVKKGQLTTTVSR